MWNHLFNIIHFWKQGWGGAKIIPINNIIHNSDRQSKITHMHTNKYMLNCEILVSWVNYINDIFFGCDIFITMPDVTTRVNLVKYIWDLCIKIAHDSTIIPKQFQQK